MGRSHRSGSDSRLDDIDLLNAHRYPESVPAWVLAQVRNNKDYQRRLEDLLKASDKRSKYKPVPLAASEPANTPGNSRNQTQNVQPQTPAGSSSEQGGIMNLIRSIFQ